MRNMHFVGSYPAPNTESAMRAMIDGTASAIELVPDGETGGRKGGIRDELLALEEHPALVVLNRGQCLSTCRSPRLAVRAGSEAEFTAASLTRLAAFDYVAHAKAARATLDELARIYSRQFTLQVGVPHYVDIAFLAFSPDFGELSGPVAHNEVFAEHLNHQIHETIAETGADNVLFQLESPHALMDPLRRVLTAARDSHDPMVGESVAEVINRATPQARFGVHLCLCDAAEEPVVRRLPSTAPIVTAIEAIEVALERPEALEYVHFPLAAGHYPPVVEPRLYRPLAALRQILPRETRIIAGLAHERQTLAEQIRVLDVVETAIGEPVEIAASCGLGWRPPGVAEHVVRRMTELAAV